MAGDRQYVLILDSGGQILKSLLWTRSNARAWQRATFDLTAYRGMTIRLAFGTYNDGDGNRTAMYTRRCLHHRVLAGSAHAFADTYRNGHRPAAHKYLSAGGFAQLCATYTHRDAYANADPISDGDADAQRHPHRNARYPAGPLAALTGRSAGQPRPSLGHHERGLSDAQRGPRRRVANSIPAR